MIGAFKNDPQCDGEGRRVDDDGSRLTNRDWFFLYVSM